MVKTAKNRYKQLIADAKRWKQVKLLKTDLKKKIKKKLKPVKMVKTSWKHFKTDLKKGYNK